MERTRREFGEGERRWRAVEAWRGPGGHGLLYFLPLDGGDPADDDRLDGRSALAPDEGLRGLDDEELARRRGDAAPLTETERRFEAPDGGTWLAQSIGPVWADEDIAAGLTGILFTRLDGPHRRLTGRGGHVGRLGPEELGRRWREAAAEGDAGDGAEADGERDEGPDGPGEGGSRTP
jgi:hypothetical protein